MAAGEPPRPGHGTRASPAPGHGHGTPPRPAAEHAPTLRARVRALPSTSDCSTPYETAPLYVPLHLRPLPSTSECSPPPTQCPFVWRENDAVTDSVSPRYSWVRLTALSHNESREREGGREGGREGERERERRDGAPGTATAR